MTIAEADGAQARLPIVEFIVLIAMLFALTAFSIDSMLPALPRIATELSPGEPNRAQLIIASFVLGMGLGTFVTGPISDAIGRRRVIIGGAAIYSVGAALAWAAPSLELIIALPCYSCLCARSRDPFQCPLIAHILRLPLLQ